MAPPPPRGRTWPQVQDKLERPKVESLLTAPVEEEVELAALPLLTELPQLSALPQLAPQARLAPQAQLTAEAIPQLQAVLKPLGVRAVAGAAAFDLSDDVRARLKVINNLVLVVPPKPKEPPRQLWWMPAFRYRNPLTDNRHRMDPLLRPGTLVDIDTALRALAQSQGGDRLFEWRPALVPNLWANAVVNEREALVGYPEGYIELDPAKYPPELWEMIKERFVLLRARLFSDPERIAALPVARFGMLEHIQLWAGVEGVSVGTIIKSSDAPNAEVTSLLAAACDYICWRCPQLLGPQGEELVRWQQRMDLLEEEKYPLDNLFFPWHHDNVQIDRSQQGHRISLRGGFAVAVDDQLRPQITYVSAAGMMGEKMPNGVPGWRQITCVPVPSYPPRHVCGVDCNNWSCPKVDDPLVDDPPPEYAC